MLRQGELALCGGNSPQWIISAFAVIYSGAVLLSIDRRADEDTLVDILRDRGAGLVSADEDAADKNRQNRSSDFAGHLPARHTGRPKGVPLSHANLCNQSKVIREVN